MEQKKFEYICRNDKKILVKGYCENDKKIVIEDDVTTIGPFAFAGFKMEELVLPCSLEKMYDFAFSDCANLRKITISKGIRENVPEFGYSISNTAFIGCTSVTEIECLANSNNNMEDEYMWEFNIVYNLLYLIMNENILGRNQISDALEKVFEKQQQFTVSITVKDNSLLIPKYIYYDYKVKLLKSARKYLEEISNITHKETTKKSFFDSLPIAGKTYCIATAIEMYMLTGDEAAKEYIQCHAGDVCKYIMKSQNDTVFAQFLNLNLLSLKILKDVFDVLDKAKMPLSTAYLLQSMQEENIKDKNNLDL